jgi:glutamate formiminotransferase
MVECVPNFSEGRDKEKIKRIMSVFDDHDAVKVISHEPDADYNRTVVTLIGPPEPMVAAVLDLVGAAVKEIDLNEHEGIHPRMGAVDVIPFVPVENMSINDCVELSKTMGEKIAEVHDIPVFLYAESATSRKRKSLPKIRKGEFEGMKEKIKDKAWAPDYGEAEIHPTFGAVAVGARQFLIAYNIDLDTDDRSVAKKLSRVIRKSSGGFQYIQAGPAYLEERGHVQVTMNILNYKKNPIYRIFEVVKMEAKRYNVDVPSAEIVGLIPKDALEESVRYYLDCEFLSYDETMDLDSLVFNVREHLRLRDFDKDKIIESHLDAS